MAYCVCFTGTIGDHLNRPGAILSWARRSLVLIGEILSWARTLLALIGAKAPRGAKPSEHIDGKYHYKKAQPHHISPFSSFVFAFSSTTTMSKPTSSDAQNDIPILGDITNRSQPGAAARAEALIRSYVPPNGTICPDLEEVPDDHPAWVDWIKSYHDFFDLTVARAHEDSIHASPYIAPSPQKGAIVFFAVFLGENDLAKKYDRWLRQPVQDYIASKFRTNLEVRFYQMTFGPHVGFRPDPHRMKKYEVRNVPMMGDSIGNSITTAAGSICAFFRILNDDDSLSDEQYALTCYHVVAGMDRGSPFLSNPKGDHSVSGLASTPALSDYEQNHENELRNLAAHREQLWELESKRRKYSDPTEREELEFRASSVFKLQQRQKYMDLISEIDNDQQVEDMRREIREAEDETKNYSSRDALLGSVVWGSGLVPAQPLVQDSYTEPCLMDYAFVRVEKGRYGINHLGATREMWDAANTLSGQFVTKQGQVHLYNDFQAPDHYAGEVHAADEDFAPVMDVIKHGRTTDVTRGKTRLRRMVYIRANDKIWADYAIVAPKDKVFSAKGDSGSPVIVRRRGLVGMITGGSSDAMVNQDVSFFLPFRMIQEDFLKRIGLQLVWDHRQTGRMGGFEQYLPERQKDDKKEDKKENKKP